MTEDDVSFNRRLTLLVLASLLTFATAVVLRIGIGATPYSETDSAGRTMGFNDPLSAEHYLIMIRNFDPVKLLTREYLYEWVLLAMHLVGAVLLISTPRVSLTLTRWFFAAQLLIFPLGVPAAVLLALGSVVNLLHGNIFPRFDRETFVDLPFIAFFSHPTWVVISAVVAIALRPKEPLSIWIPDACARVVRAAIPAFRKGPERDR